MKFLPIDIETAPMESFHWDKRTDFIASGFNEQETTILCASFRKPGKKIETVSIADFNKKLTYRSVRKDKGVTKVLQELLTWCADENIVVVYQNGDRFDLPKIIGRTVAHRLPAIPRKFLTTIDTMKKARVLGMDYCNLDSMDKRLNGAGKVVTRGWHMWQEIVSRHSDHVTRTAALKEMTNYCEGDIESLERVFDRLLPYMDNLPNMNLWQGTQECCPACGSENTIYRSKPKHARVQSYRRMSCNDCGKWFQETGKIKADKVMVAA